MIPNLPIAEFSDDGGNEDGKGNYRFTLWRYLEPPLFFFDGKRPSGAIAEPPAEFSNGYVQFIGLNPSKATETKDDNTITRCIDFATRWGFGAMLMTNAFAWRDTHPEKMKKEAKEPEGDPRNLARILELAEGAAMIVPAWGSHGKFRYRDRVLREALKPFQAKIRAFHISMQGQPDHPLMHPREIELVHFPL